MCNKIHSYLILLLIVIIIYPSSGSALEISGNVTDTEKTPLVGVSVSTDVTGVGTITDSAGKYSLPFHTGIKRVLFSSIGYKPISFLVEEIPITIIMQPVYYRSADILVTSDRAEIGITPIAFDNLSADDIARDYTVGEFPLLLQSTPNLLSFSDGGASLGYSYTKIRGFDDKRIVTYINGVPLNDPEDHATYFVDLPDFPANVSDIQVQRGVGNSLYGDASFGGTINIVTSAFDSKQSASLTAGYGEYSNGGDIYKQSVEFSSGLVDGKWAYNGRFSKQKTGGYKHHSWYEGWSYYFSLGRIEPKMTTELYVYGGPIRMHLAYNGAPRRQTDIDRRYNNLTYSNETDNFNQPHYHLHNIYRINKNASLSNTLYYIRGKGYYEQYKAGSNYTDYDIDSYSDSSAGDVVRQQWVEKNQYGWNPRLDIEHDQGKHSIGGSIYYFESDHWGQVVWAQYISGQLDPRKRYYQYFGEKIVGSFFVQEYYKLNDKLSTQVTAQIRYQKYKLDSKAIGAFTGYDYNLDWLFFSPRIGFTYTLNDRTSLFTNFSVASRTPSDVAIYDANDPNVIPSLDASGETTAKSERVYDFELGGSYVDSKTNVGVNIFYMSFKDEIVPYGGINESGIAFTTNLEKSIHAGLELQAAYQLNDNIVLSGNASFNFNRVKDFIDTVTVYSNDFSSERDSLFDLSDNKIPAFPDFLSYGMIDYHAKKIRLTFSSQFVGEQFAEIHNIDSLKIDPYMVSSFSASYSFENIFGDGKFIVQFRIDNLFNDKHEVSGYGWLYGVDDSGGTAQMIRECEYYVAPERSIYGQLKLELF